MAPPPGRVGGGVRGGAHAVRVAHATVIRAQEGVRKCLVCQAAADRGMLVSSELIDKEIERGNFFLGGQRISLRRSIFDDDLFNFQKFKRWVEQLQPASAAANGCYIGA